MNGLYWAVLSLVGCSGAVGKDRAEGRGDTADTSAPAGPLTLSPASASLVVGCDPEVAFAATGGVPPYTFSVASGQGSIDPGTGVFVPSPAPGSVIVRVIDGDGATDDAALQVGLAEQTTWSTVDDFDYANADLTQATDIATGPGGEIYAVGMAELDYSNSLWLVRRSDDDGASWTTVDQYRHPTAEVEGRARADAVAIAPDGTVYVGGRAEVEREERGVIRRSIDGGANWTTVDEIPAPDNDSYAVVSLAVGSGGRVFAGLADSQSDAAISARWTIRTSGDMGENWEVADDVPAGVALPPYTFGAVADMVVDAAGAVYASGSLNDGETSRWLVRRSVDDGESWSTILDYGLSDGRTASGTGIGVTPDGEIVTSGIVAGNGPARWLLRSSPDGGVSWTDDDEFGPFAGWGAFCTDLLVDAAGRIDVVGSSAPSGYREYHWFVRRRTTPEGPWEVADDHEIPDALGSRPFAAAQSATGGHFVAGFAQVDFNGDQLRWLVRKESPVCP